jgi:hypothetical protein
MFSSCFIPYPIPALHLTSSQILPFHIFLVLLHLIYSFILLLSLSSICFLSMYSSSSYFPTPSPFLHLTFSYSSFQFPSLAIPLFLPTLSFLLLFLHHLPSSSTLPYHPHLLFLYHFLFLLITSSPTLPIHLLLFLPHLLHSIQPPILLLQSHFLFLLLFSSSSPALPSLLLLLHPHILFLYSASPLNFIGCPGPRDCAFGAWKSCRVAM